MKLDKNFRVQQSVKRMAAAYLDGNRRGEFLRAMCDAQATNERTARRREQPKAAREEPNEQ